MKIKKGDVIEFLAISWDEPQWEFDYPCVVLKPCVVYSSSGNNPEQLIEDMAIDLSCGEDIKDEDISEEFNWRGWKLSTLRRVSKERLKGKDIWKTKIRSVVMQKIQFFEKNGELEFNIIETIEK